MGVMPEDSRRSRLGGSLSRNGDGVADAGYALPLERGGRRVESAGGAEKNVVPFALPHSIEQVARQHRGCAAAAGTSAVDILTLRVENKHPAVGVVGQFQPVLPEQLQQQLAAQITQVACDDQVIVLPKDCM